jgi:hypothetical protein
MSALIDDPGLSRVLAVRPHWVGLERAGDALGLGPRELLHAGPPLPDPRSPCVPVAHAAICAILLEGWASDADAARALISDGGVVFRPAQDRGCTVPLADVLSPSMWVQRVRDAAGVAPDAFSPINGGAEHPQRVGVLGPAVVAHLRWLGERFAPAWRAAASEPVALAPIADAGLALGDDGHGRTAGSTARLAAEVDARLAGPAGDEARAYLARSPGFFLNLWMAASRCMLSAAAGSRGSDIVVAAGGNGQTCGIQVAGDAGRWLIAAAEPPVIPGSSSELAARSLGAIGDSAIVDLLGFGGMCSLRSAPPAPPEVLAAWGGASPAALLSVEHPAMPRTGPRVIVRAGQVLRAGDLPRVSLGVLDRFGELGRIGGGFHCPPRSLFEAARAALG